MAIPSEKTKEFAKSHWGGVIIGTIIFAGCIYIGNWIFGKISFNLDEKIHSSAMKMAEEN